MASTRSSSPTRLPEVKNPSGATSAVGPPPAPRQRAARVGRRVSSRGSITIARQKIRVGIDHAGCTVTVEEADTTFRVYDGIQLLAEVIRTTTQPIARFKVRTPDQSSLALDANVRSAPGAQIDTVRSVTVLKGLLEALALVVVAAVVAAIGAVVWISVGEGSFISRLGICLLVLGALFGVAGVLSQASSSDTFDWFGPERADAGGGRVLTGIGIALFVGAPLILAGAVLLT